MKDVQSTCSSFLDLSSNAGCLGSSFNPSFFYSPSLKLVQFPNVSTSSLIDVTLDSVHYKLESDGTFTSLSNLASNAIQYVSNTSGCFCMNHVKYVYYTFGFKNLSGDSFLFPTSVKASFVLGTTSKAAGSCSTVSLVKQHFESTFLQDGLTNEVWFSGNPGYLQGRELLLGKKQGSSVQWPYNGFKLRSWTDKTTGQCSSSLLTVDSTND